MVIVIVLGTNGNFQNLHSLSMFWSLLGLFTAIKTIHEKFTLYEFCPIGRTKLFQCHERLFLSYRFFPTPFKDIHIEWHLP